MASFKNRTRDEIPSANLIAHLDILPSAKNSFYKGCGTWCCAFSQDDSYFAWSVGYGIVTVIPWKNTKSNLLHFRHSSTVSKNSLKIVLDNIEDLAQYFGPKAITIKTGFVVRSLAFAYSDSYCDNNVSLPFWIRFSSLKNLILATGHSNGRIRTWDVSTGKLMLELIDHQDLVSDLAFCPSGNLLLVSASCDGTLKVWDLQDDGNMFRTLKMGGKPVYSCSWSPDSNSLVSVGMSKIVFVWDMTTYTVKLQLKGHHHDVVACAFSPDNCLIATASWDTRVILWDSYSGQMLKYFCHLHPMPHLIYACGDNGTWIRDVSFSPDGAHIATVADDGYLRFWDIGSEHNPEAVATVENALCCRYSPSGQVVAVGGRDGVVSFWYSTACVKSLMFLARVAVRRHFPPDSIDSLEIPNCLTEYLKYKE